MTIEEYELRVQEARANTTKPMPYARSFSQKNLGPCAKTVDHDRLKAYRSSVAFTSLDRLTDEGLSMVFYSKAEGTNTKMHMDMSDSFFTQVYGRKRWLFADPQHATQLKIYADTMNFVFISGYDVHREPLPLEVPLREVILNPGDVLYFPPMCFHAVFNLDRMTLGVDDIAMDPVGAFKRHWLLTASTIFNPRIPSFILQKLWRTGHFDAYDIWFDRYAANSRDS